MASTQLELAFVRYVLYFNKSNYKPLTVFCLKLQVSERRGSIKYEMVGKLSSRQSLFVDYPYLGMSPAKAPLV